MVHLAREPVRRKPFGHRIRVDERPIDLLGRRTQHAVKPDGVCRHYLLLSLGRSSRFKGDLGVMALPPNRAFSCQHRSPNGDADATFATPCVAEARRWSAATPC